MSRNPVTVGNNITHFPRCRSYDLIAKRAPPTPPTSGRLAETTVEQVDEPTVEQVDEPTVERENR